jgi:hypothetical protein
VFFKISFKKLQKNVLLDGVAFFSFPKIQFFFSVEGDELAEVVQVVNTGSGSQ